MVGGILVSRPRIEPPGPQQRKCSVFTIGPPGYFPNSSETNDQTKNAVETRGAVATRGKEMGGGTKWIKGISSLVTDVD